MDFLKLVKLSQADMSEVWRANEMYQKANAIVERSDLTKREFQIVVELERFAGKAYREAVCIPIIYQVRDAAEVILEKNQYVLEKLVKQGETLVWESYFYGITDSTQKWNGKVVISPEEIFELYKAEYLYEHFKEFIPRDYIKYFERCYSVAGMFKIFIEKTRLKEGELFKNTKG